MDRIERLLAEYDDRASEVSNADHRFFKATLERWLDLLDETPEFSVVCQRLEASVDFARWYEDLERRQASHGMGSAPLSLPKGRDENLGIRIALFRAMTDGRINGADFAHTYISSDRSVNQNLRDLDGQVFDPTVRELRRRIEWSARGVEEPSPVPASDRIVTINHNSPDFHELIDALDDVQRSLKSVNDYDDPEEKEQVAAEIEAGRKLLDAPRARALAVAATLGTALGFLAVRFADAVLGKIADVALDKLGHLLPAILDYLTKW